MRIKILLIALLGIGLISPLHVSAANSTTDAVQPLSVDEIIPGQLIVGMKPGLSINSLVLPENSGLSKKRSGLDKLNAGLITVPAGAEAQYIEKLKNTKGVLFAEPNYRVSAAIIPDDSLWPQQYGPSMIQAPAAWDITSGSDTVILAVIDSGVDLNHPEFSGRIVPGYDFVDDDDQPQDLCGHGTHVAGIAAASGNNGEGIAGIAWNAGIMPLRVLGNTCGGATADVAEALVWAVEHGARVINLSLGTSSISTLMENGTYYAYTHGAAIFAASGNLGSSLTFYPAAYPWVMSVGAVTSLGQRASYSNTGSALDVMAPGSGIYSTLPMQSGFLFNLACPNGPYICGKATQYDALNGTSMASAFVAGGAALMASLAMFDTPDKIYQAFTSTSLDMDVAGRDNNTGYGLIQLADALAFTPVVVPTPIPTFAVEYDVVNSTTCNNLVQYGWRDATGGTSWLFTPDTNNGFVNPPINLPFNFNLASQPYTSIAPHANGYISMGSDTRSYSDNFILPGIAQPNNFIAPFWDDLRSNTNGVLYTSTFGLAPNREFVIEWTALQRVADLNSVLQFEVVLFENSGEILMQYHTLSGVGSDGSSATIGIEYENGLAAREYSYNRTSALTENLALLFIPYPTGGVPPSTNCSTFTAPVDSGGGTYDAPPFCVLIPQGAMEHSATLQIEPLISVPYPMPSPMVDLQHYADITLTYSPAPPLSPMPEAYVCYHYTDQDTLMAGGHPENLFMTAYDATTNQWEALPTSVDSGQGLLLALAPHFSIYGVATFNVIGSSEVRLPVTGSPISREFLILLICIGVLLIFLKRKIWVN